jgi:putative spermidine/putrescine transport system permease protein
MSALLKPRAAWLVVPALLFIIVIFVIPVVSILTRSVTTPPGGLYYYQDFFTTSGYLKVLANTVRLGVIVTTITLMLGMPYAYILATARPRRQRVLTTILLVPLWTSWLVSGYAWLTLLSPSGPVNKALLGLGIVDAPVTLTGNLFGVVVAMVQILLPYMVLPLFAVMRTVDARLIPAARSLGAPGFAAFRTVYLPQILPGLAGGCLLVFIVTCGYYVIPALLGGAQNTMLGELIATEISSLLNWGLGTAMAAVLLVATFVLMALFSRVVRTSDPGSLL